MSTAKIVPQDPPGPTSPWTVVPFLKDPIAILARAESRYGPVVRFKFGPYTLIQVTDLETVHQILSSPNFTISTVMNHPFFGNGLANNTGETWMQQRRLMQPAFSPRHHEILFAPLISNVAAQISAWKPYTVRDVMPDLLHIYHYILGQTVLGLDFDAYPAEYRALIYIREYLTSRYQEVISIPEQVPTPRNRRFKQAVTDFRAFIEARIKHARNRPSSANIIGLLSQASDPRTGQKMSDQQLGDEINTLLFNGYDDPANAVAWALHLLAQHPAVLARLQAEIDQTIGQHLSTIDQLTTMPYLHQVTQEVLRLFPPTWSVMRDVTVADRFLNYSIAASSFVLINIYLLHRHQDLWPEPDIFKPERFSNQEQPQGYMPFGWGPRRCIAHSMAYLIIKLILVTLIQGFELLPLSGQGVTLEAKNSLRPKSGVFLQLLPRSAEG